MTDQNEQAGYLAEVGANALASARASLSAAADIADDVDGALRRCEEDVSELSGESSRVRNAEEPRPYLRNAQELADRVDARLRDGQRGLDEISDHLDDAVRSLRTGQQALDELDQLPEQKVVATDFLRARLDSLRGAAQDAREGVEQTGSRLRAARQTLDPLIYRSAAVGDRDRTAAEIDDVSVNVDTDLLAARGRLRGSREGLGSAVPSATAAAQEGSDLAIAVRAAANPTPATGRPATSTSSEQDRRHRTAGPAQDNSRDRS